MANDTLTAFRLPRDLLDEFRAHARTEGVTLSEIARDAIRVWLDSRTGEAALEAASENPARTLNDGKHTHSVGS